MTISAAEAEAGWGGVSGRGGRGEPRGRTARSANTLGSRRPAACRCRWGRSARDGEQGRRGTALLPTRGEPGCGGHEGQEEELHSERVGPIARNRVGVGQGGERPPRRPHSFCEGMTRGPEVLVVGQNRMTSTRHAPGRRSSVSRSLPQSTRPLRTKRSAELLRPRRVPAPPTPRAPAAAARRRRRHRPPPPAAAARRAPLPARRCPLPRRPWRRRCRRRASSRSSPTSSPATSATARRSSRSSASASRSTVGCRARRARRARREPHRRAARSARAARARTQTHRARSPDRSLLRCSDQLGPVLEP